MRIKIDPESDVVSEQYAVIYTPRRKRDRFPENTVTIFASEADAVEAADPEKNLYAAKVVGPSRSSEGLTLYYLAEWLE